ncbi:uncharacterized protein V1518DRAFT_455723 [Limtongia smithiae]|uniref:uncharacterized protein n=1 Tax=Limtongia smithiae TaxID=1125753 RepID=UPI0034CEE90F
MYIRYSRLTRSTSSRTNLIIRFIRRRLTTPPPPPSPPAAAADATASTATATAPSAVRDLFNNVVKGYKRFHDRRPHTTQVLQSLVVSFVGDSLSQALLSPADEPYSPLRTLKVMITGSVLSLPTYRWFLIMGKYINHSNKYVSLALKCIANQTCFAPFFLSSFLTTGFLWQGVYDPKEIAANLKERLPIAWMNGCMYWPNVVVINFTLVPPHFRGLVNSLASVIWQAYLSFLTFSSRASVEHAIEVETELEHRVEHAVAEKLHLEHAKQAVLKAEYKVVDIVTGPHSSSSS